jgi:hypothetical protein
MGVKPLVVAAVAAVLLVVSIGVDAAMNRTLALDAREDDGAWRAIGGEPRLETRPVPVGSTIVMAGPDDNVTLRVRVDNGYPFAYDESYRVFFNGREIASGTLRAEPRGEGESVFTVPARPFWDATGRPVPGEPRPNVTYANVEVYAGSRVLYGHFQLQEARA